MCFWLVIDIIEIGSDMPAPQFGEESSRVRGSELVQTVSVFCLDVKRRAPTKTYPRTPWVQVPHVSVLR
jgi:hypothetical protein